MDPGGRWMQAAKDRTLPDGNSLNSDDVFKLLLAGML